MQVQLGEITIDVVLKNIKNVHLSVHPPMGEVTIAAPAHLNLDAIRIFAISKLGWIQRQRRKFCEQERETHREFLDLESHYVWGSRRLLKIIEGNQPPSAELSHRHLLLRVRPGTDELTRRSVLEKWYREQIKHAVPPLIVKWEPLLGVTVRGFFVQRMKTQWGSCNHLSRTIRLNTDLAKKPPQCLEYVVVHELAHLIEPTHNARFLALMDQSLPNWKRWKAHLNQLPIREIS